MADTASRGLGSPNMDQKKKQKIHSKGGQASHSGGRHSGQKGGKSQKGFTEMAGGLMGDVFDSGGNSNPGNFANDKKRASEAGRKGGSQ